MITISGLIESLTTCFQEEVEVIYLHPTLYVVCTDASFNNLEKEERESLIVQRCGIQRNELHRLQSLGIVELALLTPTERKVEYSFLGVVDEGQHWLAWLHKHRRETLSAVVREKPRTRAVHFYGFKGGQARSTVLVLLAKALADEGMRVLLVDADAEAPSLDVLLSVVADAPEATLMGLCGWADSIRPIARTYVGKKGVGEIDLLACRPRSDAYDMDFAAFLLSVGLDARALESATHKLRAYVEPPDKEKEARYDVVLFDHRTGLAPSVLPIMNAWPGPAVLFARLDAMSHHMPDTKIFDILLSHDRDTPGAFVTFSLNTKATRESMRETHGKVIEGLLASLLDAFSLETNEFDIDPATLEPNWVMWQYDPALLFELPPNPSDLTPDNQKSLAQLREVLGLEHGVLVPQAKPTDQNLTLSGATDEGWFIRTQDLDLLFTRDSKFIYILGRKGTGKTRVLRQLHLEGLGEPLLVASDFSAGGISSLSPTLEELLQRCGEDWDSFWWTLLRAALECNSTNGDQLTKKVDALSFDPDFQSQQYGSAKQVEELLKHSDRRRIFLIDGVETAVRAANLRSFVESLFRFMATLQYNPHMASLVTVRLFLRIDLAKGATQNVEQQMEGRKLRLNWGKTAILNFALARIASLNWLCIYP